MLGLATDYKVYRNDSQAATIVDLYNDAQRRVLLLSLPGGKPMVESIGGILTSDTGPDSPLTDLNIDFSDFAADGVIGIPSPQSGAATKVRIGDHVARRQALLSAAGAGN